jgi:hypothetical protein
MVAQDPHSVDAAAADRAHAAHGGVSGAAPGRRRSGLRTLVYALLPLAGLLLLTEGLLFALGLGDPAERLHLTRGFDEDARYVLPDGPPGAFRTQMFDGETPEVRIPPKGARRRVLLFGGSNTELLPGEYLEEQLDLADPDPGWEVINLGRRGYGSERVRILLRQALVTEPDVVVIYSGHNEFVEGEFALELKQDWDSPLMRGVADGLSHLRVVNLLSGAARSARAQPAGGRAPEARTERLDSFAGISYDRTLLYYDAYEQNLRSMCRAAQAAGAGILLCTVVSNTLVIPSVARSRPDLNLPELVELARIGALTRQLLPERLTAGLLNAADGTPLTRLNFQDWRERNPGDAEGRVEPVLRRLTGPLAGPPLWSPVQNWTERAYVLMQGMERLHRRELGADERDAVRQAVRLCERGRVIDPGNALVIHQLATALYLSGDDDARAVKLYELAALYDHAPGTGNAITNDRVRRVAAALPGVALLDAQACFAGRCPDGLVGYEVMMDNCHLHLGARRVLLRDMLPEILRLADR